jgi:AcrR family transcriptional regulator
VPRISEQQRADRREQILDAAREQFTRNGFHATSMDDIIGAAGMSPGGVYRYFTGKDAIIAAIAEGAVGSLSAAVDTVLRTEPAPALSDAMRELVARIDDVAGSVGRLAIVIWGEAQRDPAIAALAAQQGSRIRDGVTRLVARAQETGELPADADTDALGAATFSLLAGYLVQTRILGGLDPGTYAQAVAQLLASPRPRPRTRRATRTAVAP